MVKKNATAVSVIPVQDIPCARVLKVISAAIRILNQDRKPLLKTTNARGFELCSPQQWATFYRLVGLNIVVSQLEQAKQRYAQCPRANA